MNKRNALELAAEDIATAARAIDIQRKVSRRGGRDSFSILDCPVADCAGADPKRLERAVNRALRVGAAFGLLNSCLSRSVVLCRLLRENGMAYYGGGASRAEAESVLYLTAGGQRIAFIGFNEVGPPEAWATDTEAGAARLSKPLLEEKLREATAGAPIVFAMVQCTNENEPVPWPSQVRLFHSAIDLGATITGSSSAHRAMGLEFYRGRLIIYGLGNFLFDQMQTVHHRRGMIARHHFHDGRHVQTELIPYIIHDYCRPRLLQGGPARELMDEVFRYSRGPVFD